MGDGTRPANLHGTAAFNESLCLCALSASYISQGHPLDSLKWRLQTMKTPITVARLAGLVLGHTQTALSGSASFTIYTETKDYCRAHNYLNWNSVFDAAMVGGIGGALSGSLISFGSAPFELVKLEYTIAASRGVHFVKPPGTVAAMKEIIQTRGINYNRHVHGLRLHFLRDTLGTALYFLEHDGMWRLLGRDRNGEQGATASWLPIHSSLARFVCGSLSGVTFPLPIYLPHLIPRYQGVFETLHRLVRGPDPAAPKLILAGCA
ncbi:mitochondrial carrier domain-containing protein [Mycena galopus ATCC 62051]|nr:mitochondrial carrier domain-containing protein [Mycena galopus ATCC 62051]